MADFTELKNAIREVIKENGNGEITGDILQNVLLAVLDAVNNKLISGDLDAEGHLFADADGMYSLFGGFKLLLPETDNDRFFDNADGMLAEQGPILVVRELMQTIGEVIGANPWLDSTGAYDMDRAWNRLVYWATHNPRLDISDYTGEKTIVAPSNVIIKTAEERGKIEVFCDTRTGRDEPLQLYIDFDLREQGEIYSTFGTEEYVRISQGIALANGLGDAAKNLLLPGDNYFLANRRYFAEGAPILSVPNSWADGERHPFDELAEYNDWLNEEASATEMMAVLGYWAKHNPVLRIGNHSHFTFSYISIYDTQITCNSYWQEPDQSQGMQFTEVTITEAGIQIRREEV